MPITIRSTNQITFPAAILQPPYFDPNADPAANYGSIGATIGHEIGHGFDDQGRKFDGIGRLRDWWTKATAAKYEAQAAGAGQAVRPVTSRFRACTSRASRRSARISATSAGSRSLTPPTADMSREHGEPPVIGGFTGDQRFFIAYGYSWESK